MVANSKTRTKTKSKRQTKTKKIPKGQMKTAGLAGITGLAGLAIAYKTYKTLNPELTEEQKKENIKVLLVKIEDNLNNINKELNKSYLPFSSRMQLLKEKNKLEEYKEQIQEERKEPVSLTWYEYFFG